jgi:hypothetical protein
LLWFSSFAARERFFFVTHLYEFARRLWAEQKENAVFLRAERQSDGRRTFKLFPAEPLQTSFGPDLYQAIFSGVAEGADTVPGVAETSAKSPR